MRVAMTYRAIVLASGLSLLASSSAAEEAILQAGAVFCLTRGSAESSNPDMNDKQLASLGCVKVGKEWKVEAKPSLDGTRNYVQVDLVLPDRVIQGWAWVNRSPGICWPSLVLKTAEKPPSRRLEDAVPACPQH
jgi:hypothetical protein